MRIFVLFSCLGLITAFTWHPHVVRCYKALRLASSDDEKSKPTALELRLIEEERRNRFRQAKLRVQKERQAQEAMSLPQDPLVRTIPGGTDVIFKMAKKWRQEAALMESQETAAAAAPSSADKGQSTLSPTPESTDSKTYAKSIWRNVRKSKPALWKHALRCYHRVAPAQRTHVHHSGALVACSKLGLWKDALEIYQRAKLHDNGMQVMDRMILSIIRACVQASRNLHCGTTTLKEQRAPLDAAVQIVQNDLRRSNLPIVARHINPLASAYQGLGLTKEASQLIHQHLQNRTIGPEAELSSENVLNVQDIGAKDKGSYALLVKGAVLTGDWGEAVDALSEMTTAGLYPKNRHVNSWTEVSEKYS